MFHSWQWETPSTYVPKPPTSKATAAECLDSRSLDITMSTAQPWEKSFGYTVVAAIIQARGLEQKQVIIDAYMDRTIDMALSQT